ncbi:MAG: DUF1499 domain-containing protein [Caldilineaceae bacterium]|nr:DUF1499 domain-containing protein [Caldilineaceae bacterium]
MTFRKMWYLALCMATLGLAGCSGDAPSTLGMTDGRLTPCPDSPNCVSSQVENGYPAMEPIPLSLPADETQDVLVAALEEMDGVEVVSTEPGYVHAEAKSRLLGFVDDMEFAIDESDGVIHYRSASRMGYGDMGANRERMVQFWGLYSQVVEKSGGREVEGFGVSG